MTKEQGLVIMLHEKGSNSKKNKKDGSFGDGGRTND